MPKITFLPANATIECNDGESVFDVGRRNDIAIETACVGNGSCGRCRVKIVDGEQFLPPFNDIEKNHLGNVYFITKVRLACQSIVRGGDVTVEVPSPKKKR
jgi:ferredoxin